MAQDKIISVRGRDFFLKQAKSLTKKRVEEIFKSYGFKTEVVKVAYHEMKEAITKAEKSK